MREPAPYRCDAEGCSNRIEGDYRAGDLPLPFVRRWFVVEILQVGDRENRQRLTITRWPTVEPPDGQNVPGMHICSEECLIKTISKLLRERICGPRVSAPIKEYETYKNDFVHDFTPDR